MSDRQINLEATRALWLDDPMNPMQLAVLGAGISFTGIGVLMRRQKKNWKALLFGGITLLVLAVISLLFGFSL